MQWGHTCVCVGVWYCVSEEGNNKGETKEWCTIRLPKNYPLCGVKLSPVFGIIQVSVVYIHFKGGVII